MGLFDRVKVSRAVEVLQVLPRLVPPRVLAAVWRLWWNGWCTARRFQGKGCCRLGCGGDAEDSIEHYCLCPRLAEFAWKFMRVPFHGLDYCARRRQFLLLDSVLPDPAHLTRCALKVAAMYSVLNLARATGCDGTTACEALPQALRDSVRGHAQAMQIVDASWVA